MSWEAVIGLEIHVQLATRSKIFSGSANQFGAPPNSQASLIDLGFPGVLPVLNQQAVIMALKFGLACNAKINQRSIFARKNYFYPDLPKGYQISQFEVPIVGPGEMIIELEDGAQKVIGITRAHLEEDAGKSIHDEFTEFSAIDLNRAGTPLLEIVSEPDMRSAKEAIAYLKKIHALVQYLEICDGNLQEGSFRCDVNVSVRRQKHNERVRNKLGTRTELKNLNSFKFIEKAINHEIARHIDVIEEGGVIVQETRLYDPETNVTHSMRTKEEADDYRYFPDPDLLPLVIEDDVLIELRSSLPELPEAKKRRYETEFGLSHYDATVLTAKKTTANYFEELVQLVKGEEKLAANWVTGVLGAALNKDGIDESQSPVTPSRMANLLERVVDGTISGKIAKGVFEDMWGSTDSADEIIEQKGLKQISDRSELQTIIAQVMQANPTQVQQYRSGKNKLLGFFVGQVMKVTQGQANPSQVNQILVQMLSDEE